MNTIPLIETEEALASYLAKLRTDGIKTLALDLEGDQGSIHYHYSVAILQCFDGREAVVIDVVKIRNGPVLREFLTCPDIVKVMFSCKNDLFMTQNTLGCTIEPVRDIALAQKMLGKTVNISEHIGIGKQAKDNYQRANWLKRPLTPDLIQYAVNDVLHLLRVQNDLEEELREKGLFEQFLNTSRDMPKKNYIVDQYEQYKEKFPGFERLRADKQRLAGILWAFREMIGEHFDCPVGYIIPKAAMNEIIKDKDHMLEKLEKELNRNRRAGIDAELVSRLYRKAWARFERK
jgi:ribonuclease D